MLKGVNPVCGKKESLIIKGLRHLLEGVNVLEWALYSLLSYATDTYGKINVLTDAEDYKNLFFSFY